VGQSLSKRLKKKFGEEANCEGPASSGALVSPLNFLRKLLRGSPRRARSSPTGNPGLGLRAGLSVHGLFTAFDERNTSYVVLRWFDGLPDGKPDGDIDLLVDDRDLPSIADLFEHNPQAVQCDLFSVSGLPGTTYRGMPYLPPDKAAGMLTRATRFKDTCRVPSPEDHFLSLAYHAVYQKGLRAGLPTSRAGLTPNAAPKHDYAGALGALAEALGIDVTMSLEGLDEYLRERGWRPSPEVMAKLAMHNKWLAARLEQAPAPSQSSAPADAASDRERRAKP